MTAPDDGDTGTPDDAWGHGWSEADERRYQERRAEERAAVRRRWRHGIVFTLLVLAVLAAGTTAAGVYRGWWEWPPWSEWGAPEPARTVVACPTPETTAAPAAEVTLTVLNSTSRTGLAGSTAEQLTARGFTVGAVGNDSGAPIAGTAVVRHGPEGLLAARTVAAHVPGAQLVDDARAGAVVELSLGETFEALRPPEEAATLLAPEPVPSPAGCVVPAPVGTTSPPPASTAPPAPATTG